MTNTNTKTKAILYARFSPRPNAAECESCQSQLAEMRRWAEQRGYDVVGEYQDEAVSGADDWNERPGMFDAAKAAKRGMLFCVRSFDRMFRDTKNGLAFAGMLAQKGVRVMSITEEAASLATPEAELMRTILLGMAEYQRKMINARTRSRMQSHQRAGRRMSKIPPFGMAISEDDPSRLVANADEKAIIWHICSMHKTGLGLRAIAKCLEHRGILCRGAAKWSHKTVTKILRREGALQ